MPSAAVPTAPLLTEVLEETPRLRATVETLCSATTAPSMLPKRTQRPPGSASAPGEQWVLSSRARALFLHVLKPPRVRRQTTGLWSQPAPASGHRPPSAGTSTTGTASRRRRRPRLAQWVATDIPEAVREATLAALIDAACSTQCPPRDDAWQEALRPAAEALLRQMDGGADPMRLLAALLPDSESARARRNFMQVLFDALPAREPAQRVAELLCAVGGEAKTRRAILAALSPNLWAVLVEKLVDGSPATVDADDWRCLDTYAEYLMARGDRGDTARDLMARGLAAVERLGVPESPKTLVFRGKALVMLGELDAGCALFDRCVERFPHAGFAWIDAGICALRDPARREAQEATFEKALALARRPEHVDAARANLAEFRRWRDSGWAGTFDGTLVY